VRVRETLPDAVLGRADEVVLVDLTPETLLDRLRDGKVYPAERVPAALNGFALWNVLVLIVMLLAYGYPIAQFAIAPSPSAIVHRIE